MRKLMVALCVIAFGCGIAACERSQVVTYKQGKYQGKTDTKPWENEQFKGDQAAWERAMKARNLAQNEYKQTN